MNLGMAIVLALASSFQDQQAQDYANLLKDTKLGLAEGISVASKENKNGIAYKAELEGDKTVHWAVDLAQGTKVLAVDVDAKTGKIVATDEEPTNMSALAKAVKITLLNAIETAVKAKPGQAVSAQFRLAGEKAQAVILILAKDKIKSVIVDGETGEIAGKQAKTSEAKAFTDQFPVDEADLASTGRNRFMILEPGYFQIFEGKEEGKEVKIHITVLAETKKFGAVECRVLEDRVWEDGQLVEVARDYVAISRKTSDVYYFGEDVDNYKGGKLANHDGSWLDGEKGAKFGLLTPGTPLLGARFYQELAPNVGMDRIEIVSLSEVVETPAGKFEHCMKTEETSPLEPGMTDYKLFAPGIGCVQEGGAKLVKYGFSKP